MCTEVYTDDPATYIYYEWITTRRESDEYTPRRELLTAGLQVLRSPIVYIQTCQHQVVRHSKHLVYKSTYTLEWVGLIASPARPAQSALLDRPMTSRKCATSVLGSNIKLNGFWCDTIPGTNAVSSIGRLGSSEILNAQKMVAEAM